MKTKADYMTILDGITVSDSLWDDGERIVTVNGEPIGCTVQRPETDRWWPGLKEAIAEHLAKEAKGYGQQGEP